MTILGRGGGGKSNDNNDGNSNYKSWQGECIHSHLSDDKAVAKMGHPFVLGSLRAVRYNCSGNGNCNGRD